METSVADFNSNYEQFHQLKSPHAHISRWRPICTKQWRQGARNLKSAPARKMAKNAQRRRTARANGPAPTMNADSSLLFKFQLIFSSCTRSNSVSFVHPTRVQETKHLLIFHATEVFVALYKVGLDPSHIVPIAHIGASTSIFLCDETIKEVERIMGSILQLDLEQFSVAQPYFFEMCGETSGGKVRHMHIQVVAV